MCCIPTFFCKNPIFCSWYNLPRDFIVNPLLIFFWSFQIAISKLINIIHINLMKNNIKKGYNIIFFAYLLHFQICIIIKQSNVFFWYSNAHFLISKKLYLIRASCFSIMVPKKGSEISQSSCSVLKFSKKIKIKIRIHLPIIKSTT